MSHAWEVTADDVQTVLQRHGLAKTDKEAAAILNDHIDAAEIEQAVLEYTDFANQVACALEAIEEQLIGAGVLPEGGLRHFEFCFDAISDFKVQKNEE